MSIPDSEQYAHMLDAAATGGYACPAVNVTSSETLNVAVRGFAEAESDGIVEVTTGGAGRRFRSCLDAVVSAGVASACRPSGSRQSLSRNVVVVPRVPADRLRRPRTRSVA